MKTDEKIKKAIIEQKMPPCPFCGGNVLLMNMAFLDGKGLYVYCTNCGVTLGFGENASKTEVIEKFSTRFLKLKIETN